MHHMLLFLVPLSCIVVPIRDIVNIHIPTSHISSIYSNLYPTINMEEDIIIVLIRGRSLDTSKNLSKEVLVSFTTLSKLYHKCMEIQNLNSLWFGQVENECFPQSSSTNIGKCNISNGSGTSSNLKSKQYKDNIAPILNNMMSSHIEHIVNSQNTLDIMYIKVLINYDINTPIKANAWNSKAHPISIFGHMEFLEIDTKNVFMSLLHIANFIRAIKVQQSKISDMVEL